MGSSIPPDHPIREFFTGLVERGFRRDLGHSKPRLARYLANIMVDFSHRDRIFMIRNSRGQRVEQVAEMLMEGDVLLNATSFEREREVHKHIGDFTLFWTGIYPEMLRYFRASDRADSLIDYVERGQASYRIASTFDYAPYAEEAPVLRQLANEFEICMLGLHAVRREMDALGDPRYRSVRAMLGD